MHRSPVNSPHKGQWRGALVCSVICAWTNGWVNNQDTRGLRRHLWRQLWRHCNVIDTSPRGFDQSRHITNVSCRPGLHNRYSYIISPLRYWSQDKRVNTMATGVARPSGAMLSTTWDKLLRYFTHDTCLNVLCLIISIFCSMSNCARCYGFIFVLKIRASDGAVFSQNCMAHLSTWILGCLDYIPLMIPGNRTLSVYYPRTKCRSLWVGPSVSSWWPWFWSRESIYVSI